MNKKSYAGGGAGCAVIIFILFCAILAGIWIAAKLNGGI